MMKTNHNLGKIVIGKTNPFNLCLELFVFLIIFFEGGYDQGHPKIIPFTERNSQFQNVGKQIQTTFVGHRLGTCFSDCELEIGMPQPENKKKKLKRKVDVDVVQGKSKKRRMG